jgi:RND family efflux transporter MFP subunit
MSTNDIYNEKDTPNLPWYQSKRFHQGLAAVAVIFVAYMLFRSPETAEAEADSFELQRVLRGRFDILVRETGELRAVQFTTIRPRIRGSAQIVSIAPEGNFVEEGEVLVTLDTTELEKELNAKEIELQNAEGNLEIARNELRIQELTNETNLKQAELDLKFAQMDLQKYLEGDALLEKDQLELAVEKAKVALEKAQDKYDRMPELREKEFVSAFEVREAEIALKEADSNLNAAEKELEVWLQYTHPRQQEDYESKVDLAERGLERTQKECESLIAGKENEIRARDKNVNTIQERVDIIKEELQNMNLVAPQPGLVVYGDPNRPWERDRIEVGADTYNGQILITLPDVSQMMMRASVNEVNINKVSEGQPVEIIVDAVPDLTLKGEVTKVAQLAASQGWRRSEVKEYNVEISIDSHPEDILKPGMSARAEILIDSQPDALFVPIEAIHERGGKHYCYILERGKPVQRQVQIGQSNDENVIIIAGLEEGQEVCLFSSGVAGPETGGAAIPQAGSETESS